MHDSKAEQIDIIRKSLEQQKASNEQRLNRPLTFFQGMIAQWNLLIAQWINNPNHPALASETVEHANREYLQRFPVRTADKLHEALQSPQAYLRKVTDYELSIGGRPQVHFPTHHAWYRLIVNDPLRVEEELLFQDVVLDHCFSESVPLRIADLGTGNGRQAFGLSDMLRTSAFYSDIHFIALDLGISNLRDVLRLAEEKDVETAMHPLLADMVHLPLKTGGFDIICASSSLNLIAEYEQPLVLLEMMRCLKKGGEVLITGPNASFSAEDYVKCTAATNLEEYLLPWNMLEAHNLGQPGMIIDELSRNRCDFSYLKTDQICEAAHSMGCKPICITHWPRSGATREIYSGIRFKVTTETKRRMQGCKQEISP